MTREPLNRDRFKPSAQLQSISAPTGGWNARDNPASMNPTDAVIFKNVIATVQGVESRQGFSQHATGLPFDVETVFTHRSATGEILLAASGTKVFDVSTSVISELGTGFLNARWQADNFNGVTVLVNAADTPQSFNGTTLSGAGFTFDPPTSPVLGNVKQIRNRLWFCEVDSADVWYGEIGAITGCLKRFQLSQIATGGKCIAIGALSRDTGQGPDDFTVFVMNTGEIIVYEADVLSGFRIVGKFQGPPPLGVRSLFDLDGDLIVLTKAGYFSVSSIMTGQGRPLSSKIEQAVTDLTNDQFGWQGIVDGRKIIINAPVTTNSEYEQHVFNRVTGAWSRYTGINARQWATFKSDLYFGGDGEILKIGGTTDKGTQIPIQVLQAFSQLGGSGVKMVDAIRYWIDSGGNQTVTIGARKDFNEASITKRDLDLAAGLNGKFVSHGLRGSWFGLALEANVDKLIQWRSSDVTVRRGGFL